MHPTDQMTQPADGLDEGVEPVIVLPGARRRRDLQAGSTPSAAVPGAPRADCLDAAAEHVALAAAVDDADSPRDVLDLLILDAFTVGRQPYARSTSLENVRPDAALAPTGARLLREAIDDHSRVRLLTGEGWTLRSTHWTDGRRADLVVTALTHELAEMVLRDSTLSAVEPAPPAAERVPVGFWHQSAHGPRRRPRDIDAPQWSQIRTNYPGRVATALDTLVELTPGAGSGRMILLHGPPGTGKTTLLRALARQWRHWCQVDCVLDPERLFDDPGYLLDVALGLQGDDGEELWRLLLLEDCDELIRAEAKASTGQALSRLLNLTDGLLGQGRNVLVAITTNEDVTRLHPAVVRPGRALAHLEVGRLSPAESLAWLASAGDATGASARIPDHIHRDGATLAELFALRSGRGTISVSTPETGYGCYL